MNLFIDEYGNSILFKTIIIKIFNSFQICLDHQIQFIEKLKIAIVILSCIQIFVFLKIKAILF